MLLSAESVDPPRVDWEMWFGGEEIETGAALVEADDGGFVMAGDAGSFGAGMRDLYLVKLSGGASRLSPRGRPYTEHTYQQVC